MNSPEPAATPSRAPVNGLKVMLVVAGFFALAVLYGKWQHLQRNQVIHAQMRAATNEPAVSPNED